MNTVKNPVDYRSGCRSQRFCCRAQFVYSVTHGCGSASVNNVVSNRSTFDLRLRGEKARGEEMHSVCVYICVCVCIYIYLYIYAYMRRLIGHAHRLYPAGTNE